MNNNVKLMMEYLDPDDYGKYETPEIISFWFHYKRYDFFITSYFSDIFNEKDDFLGLEVKEYDYTLANYGIHAIEQEAVFISKEKIVISPKYRKTILNFYNRIKKLFVI